jgi:hypothetical protein
LEYAINRRLKDKKSKATGYSKQKAAEANLQFDFIDPLWIPKSSAGSLCSDNQIKNVVNMVKRHSIMHPLIPVRKNTFWNTTQIYEHCVREMYEYCYSNNFSKLWGYLWMNWYNRKDWKLFARSAYLSAMPLARTTMITESHTGRKTKNRQDYLAKKALPIFAYFHLFLLILAYFRLF